jgi:hypothetical protein
MILHFDPRQQRPPRQAAQGIDGVMLQPGRNVLPPEEIAILEASPYYQELVSSGAIVVQESEQSRPRQPTGGVPGNATQARATVANEYDEYLLRAWLEDETRTTVRVAIEQRIATLTQGGES